MLSLDTQIQFLWENRDKHIDSAPAVTSSSPTVTDAPWRLTLSGNVAFLAGENGRKAPNATDSSGMSPVLLSSHCSLTKDHRMRFRGQKNGSGDTYMKDYLGMLLKTIGNSEITFLPNSVDQCKKWIAKFRTLGVSISDTLEQELKSWGHTNGVIESPTTPKDILRKFQLLEKESTASLDRHSVPPTNTNFIKKSATFQTIHTKVTIRRMSERSNDRSVKAVWKSATQRVVHLPLAIKISKRMQAINALWTSERSYLRCLYSLVQVYQRQMKIAIKAGLISVTYEQLNGVFLNCENLLCIHQALVTGLTRACSKPSPMIGDAFQVVLPQLEAYADFMATADRQSSGLDVCLQNPTFTAFLEEILKPRDEEGINLRQLLLKPQQRLGQYVQLLEEILLNTTVDHLDYHMLRRSLDQLKTVVKELKSSPSPREEEDKIAKIIAAVGLHGASLLNSHIVKEDTSDGVKVPLVSSLKSTIKYRVVHLLLFDTALVVWSKDAKKTHYLFPLYGASIFENVAMDGKVFGNITADCSHRCFKLYSPGGPRHGAVLWFKQAEAKAEWLTILKKVVQDAQPKSTPKDATASPRSRRLRRSLSTHSLTSSFVQSLSSSIRGHSPTSTPVLTRRQERAQSIMSVTSLTSLNSTASSSATSSNSTSSSTTATLSKKGYSISELFNFLIDPPSTDYVKTFLLTYNLFTNASEVIDALTEAHQYWLTHPQGIEGKTPAAQRLRCLNALKIWVNKFYTDFRHDNTLRQKLTAYLKDVLANNSQKIFEGEKEQMKRIIDTMERSETVFTLQRNKLKAPMFMYAEEPTVRFVELSAERIACQLTLVEHEVFSRIKPFELLGQKWTKRNKRDKAPGICNFIEKFNLTTRWVVSEVLTPAQPRQRAIMIEKFIRISEACMSKNNFNSLFEITLALQSSPIRRLHLTWQEVSPEAMKLFTSYKALANPRGGFTSLREYIRKCSTPAVPYIGAFLGQLVSFEEGMPTFLEDQPDHVNFNKLTKMACTIEEIARLQMPPYGIDPDKQVLQYLFHSLDEMEDFGEDEQDSMSTEREARPKSTPLVNHRVISTVSSGSRSSGSLSHHSSEDVSQLGSSTEAVATTVAGPVQS